MMTVNDFIAFIKAQNIPGDAVIRVRDDRGYAGPINQSESIVWVCNGWRANRADAERTITFFDLEPDTDVRW